jgi:signal peptidase I
MSDDRNLPAWRGPVRKPDPQPEPFSKWELALIFVILCVCAWFMTGCQTARPLPVHDLIGLPGYTPSMRPALHGDEFTLVKRVPFESIQVGDVIAFRAHWHPVLVGHRVTQKGAGRLVTKGDNNPVEDPGFVTRKTFVGLLTHIDGRRI